MRKPKVSTLTEDIVKIDQTLFASLKGIRTLAERAQVGAESAEDKARLRKILERTIRVGKAAPALPKKEPAPHSGRVRKMARVLSLLTESQCQIVLGLAKSMTRHARNNPKIESKPDSQGLT